MVETTLQAMRNGGIYDHVGFGFHRYSTDAQWLVPHFEKMLYDQALLAMAYTEAYQATGNETYRRTARGDLHLRAARHDLAGRRFLLGRGRGQRRRRGHLLPVDPRPRSARCWARRRSNWPSISLALTEEGNFLDEATGERTGANILHLSAPIAQSASDLGLDEAELSIRLDGIRQATVRRQRKSASIPTRTTRSSPTGTG